MRQDEALLRGHASKSNCLILYKYDKDVDVSANPLDCSFSVDNLVSCDNLQTVMNIVTKQYTQQISFLTLNMALKSCAE